MKNLCAASPWKANKILLTDGFQSPSFSNFVFCRVAEYGGRYKRFQTATYGPNPVTSAGRIIGSITMVIGVGITDVFISTLAAGLIRLRTENRSNPLAYETKQTIKSKIDGLEELTEADIQILLLMIRALHDSLQKSKPNLRHHMVWA
jgi:hypothetical protein